MNWIYRKVGGRHTTFAWFFAITSWTLARMGLLTHTYVEIIIALQAYILVHSIKEDRKVPDGRPDQPRP